MSRPLFFEGWDSTVVSRVGFLLAPVAPLFMECTDDPHHRPFPQSARKGWGTRAVKCAKRMGHPTAEQVPVSGEMVVASIYPRVWGEFPDTFLARWKCRGPSTPQELHFVNFLLRSG